MENRIWTDKDNIFSFVKKKYSSKTLKKQRENLMQRMNNNGQQLQPQCLNPKKKKEKRFEKTKSARIASISYVQNYYTV